MRRYKTLSNHTKPLISIIIHQSEWVPIPLQLYLLWHVLYVQYLSINLSYHDCNTVRVSPERLFQQHDRPNVYKKNDTFTYTRFSTNSLSQTSWNIKIDGIREFNVDHAASTAMEWQYINIRISLVDFDYCNEYLKLILVTCKRSYSLKWCGVCYKMNFDNATCRNKLLCCWRYLIVLSLMSCWKLLVRSWEFSWDHKLFIFIICCL